MKNQQTLRSRIVLFFCGFLAVLLPIYSAAIYGMLIFSEDLAFARQLDENAGRIIQHVEKHGELPDFLPMHITAYSDLADVPLYLQGQVADHEPGSFEINGDNLDFHAALVLLPTTEQMLYIFYDVASIESTEQLQSAMMLYLSVAGVIVLCLGRILARTLANRILNPITELADEVQSLSLDGDTVELRSSVTPDEVGVLVATINQLSQRIAKFTRREREFTAHVSHELRTPVTVIKGAVEILQSRDVLTDQTIQRPLERIERASADMEMVIDTFLLLARQGEMPNKEETCDLPLVVSKVVDSYRHMLAAKPVAIEVDTTDSGALSVPESLVTIALGNLVRNAFSYTLQGKVEIIACADRIRVVDSGPGIDPSRVGRGLGLTIVERLCERTGWQFEVSGRDGGGTQAELIFA